MLQVNNSYNRLYYFEFLDKFRISIDKKEFHLFSMFLFEEQIKSQLVKETTPTYQHRYSNHKQGIEINTQNYRMICQFVLIYVETFNTLQDGN